MAKKPKTVIRPYEILLYNVGRPDLSEYLSKTVDLYLHGGRVYADIFLNMLGGVEIADLAAIDLPTVELPVYDEEGRPKQDEQGKDVISTEPIPNQAYLFSCYFSLESPDYAPKGYTCSNKEIWSRFEEYTSHAQLDRTWEAALKNMVENTPNDDEENPKDNKRVWVDRRRRFLDWKKQSGLSDEALRYWFSCNYFPFQKKMVQAAHHNRQFHSEFFGRGKKNDWQAAGKNAAALQRILDEALAEATPGTKASQRFIQQALAFMQGKAFSTKGRRNNLHVLLFPTDGNHFTDSPKLLALLKDPATKEEAEEKIENARLKRIQDALDQQQKKSKSKLTFPKGDWQKSFIHYIEQHVRIPYENGKRQRLNQFGEMANMALERLKSTKSNFIRQLGERVLLLQKPGLPDSDLHRQLDGWMKEYLEKHSAARKQIPHIRPRMLNGLDEVCAAWAKSQDWVEAVKEVQAHSTKRFGDPALFIYLATECNAFPQADWLRIIKEWAESHERDYDLQTLRVPYFRHLSHEAKAHLNYEHRPAKKTKSANGVNRPAYTINIQAVQPKEVILELFDGENFVDVSVPFSGRRFHDEIVANPAGSVKAPRRHKLIAQKFGAKLEDLQPTATIKGAKLIPDGTWDGHGEICRFKAKISVEMEVSPPTKEQLVEKNAARFLGIDLGQRDTGAYSVWERTDPPLPDHPGPFLKNETGTLYRRLAGNGNVVWVKLIARGSIRDMAVVHQGHLQGQQYDRFHPDLKNPVTPDEKALWTSWQQQGIISEDAPCPEFLAGHKGFNDSLCFYLKHWQNRLIREAKEKSQSKNRDEQAQIVQKVLNSLPLKIAYQQIFSSRSDQPTTSKRQRARTIYAKRFQATPPSNGERRVGAGGLSYKRIETLTLLKNVCQTFLDWKEDDEDIRWQLENLQRKFNNVRLEKVKNTVSRTIAVALQYQCDAVVVEDLSMDFSGHVKKSFNRRNTTWMPKKLIEWFQMQTMLHGLYFVKINPTATSYRDHATDQESPRLTRLPLKELSLKRWENILRFFENEPNNPKDERYHSDRYAAYRKAWLDLLKELNLNNFQELRAYAQDHPDEAHYLPNYGGTVIVTASQQQHLDADQNASRNIAFRGIKQVFGLFERPKDQKRRRKKKTPKVRTRKR